MKIFAGVSTLALVAGVGLISTSPLADARAQEAGPDVAATDGATYTIPTIVKISGIQWFIRMEEGVERFAEETGHNAYQVGPANADAQLQVRIVEDEIAKGVDAITIVPFSPEAVEPVLAKAMEQGITVVSHEASAIENAVYDIEAFRNAAYGEHLMEALAQCMGEQGQYAVFVGGLTSKSHNEWVDAAVAYQEANYPDMELVGSKNETFDDQQQAYAKTQELLRAYPDVRGFQGSASTDVAGIGLALEQRGMEDDTCVMGTSLPSIASQYLETGAVDMISFWDPAEAAYVMNTVAVMLLNGETIEDGANLGVPGYENITLEGKVIYGEAWVDVTAENMDQYPF